MSEDRYAGLDEWNLRNLLRIRDRQLKQSGDMWCAAAEKSLADNHGASNSCHPAYSLWLRAKLHREPPVGVVLSDSPLGSERT